MNNNQEKKTRYPGFFACQNHDQLKAVLTDKPPTICRNCFKRISNNLVLYLAEDLALTLRIEHMAIRNSDNLDKLIDHLQRLDEALTDLEHEIKTCKEKKNEQG